MPKEVPPVDAHRAFVANTIHGIREPEHASAFFRAADLWLRVARIQRKLGHGMLTSDWIRVPKCCGFSR